MEVPLNPARSSASPATITAYKSNYELLQLKAKFYSGDRQLWQQALSMVSVLQLRGRIPHGVECTALFTAAIVNDNNVSGNSANAFLVRSAYAMAVVRFVNGILDPFQQGQFASALVNIAKVVGLPLSFVELRHAATHEQLPTLEALRTLAQRALEWLLDNFWEELPAPAQGGWKYVELKSRASAESQITVWLKIYKRFRKRNLESALTQGVPNLSDPEERTFWTAVDNLRASSASPTENHLLIKLLVKSDFLVRHAVEVKWKTANKLYMPLLDLLGPAFKFQVSLLLIDACSPLTENQFQGRSVSQADQWLTGLVPLVVAGPFPLALPHQTIKSASEVKSAIRTTMGLLDLASSTYKLLDDILLGNETLAKKQFALPPLLEDILAGVSSREESETEEKEEASDDIENEKKRQKTIAIFHEHTSWEPLLFGVASRKI